MALGLGYTQDMGTKESPRDGGWPEGALQAPPHSPACEEEVSLMAGQREFDADNFTVADHGVVCGICNDLIPLSPRTEGFAALHRNRGEFLAHSARRHLDLMR